MASEGSITHWIAELKAGNAEALGHLYRSYLPRLIGLARKKLGGAPTGLQDEEDVVQSVFRSFCHLTEKGLYPWLEDRDDLWRLLFTMTARKVGRLRRDEQLQKHRGGLTLPGAPDDETLGLEQLLDHEPTPDDAAEFAEEVKQKLEGLKDDVLRQVAQWKMENFTNEEIAQKLGCVTRTVERKLYVIRNIWENETTYRHAQNATIPRLKPVYGKARERACHLRF
jgi:RNA polymerase sigma factor (sigma-70 family)